MATVTATRNCPLCAATTIGDLHSKEFQGATWKLAHCGSCGLLFTSPTPTPSQISRFYSGGFHQELRQPGYGEKIFGPRFQRYVDWIAQFVKGGQSLDVGCSTGLLAAMLKARNFEAEGIEMHPDTAAWGAAYYKLPIQVGSLDSITLPPDRYDLVTLTEVVEHMPDPVGFLGKVHRILKPGGHALVTFPDISTPKSRYYQWLSKITGRDWLWVTARIPLHIWEFTYPTATALFKKAGFSIVGFRRFEEDGELSGKLAVLTWPVKPLHLFSKQIGSQMEFMIRKNG